LKNNNIYKPPTLHLVIKFLEVTELNDKDQFLELGTEWTEVLKSSRDDNVFYTWEWLSTWWENFHKGELLILLARSKERIFGIAPLMCVKQRLMHTFNLKTLQFIGTGISDYSNFIVRKEEEAQCLATMIEYLNKCSERWDFLNLSEIPSEYINVIRKAFSHELRSRISSTCKYILIPQSMKLIENNLAGTVRRSLRRTLRRLEEEHRVEFNIISDLDSAKDGLKTFTELHQKQWNSKKSTEEHTLPNKGFLNDIVNIFATKGWLNLSFLSADSIAISSCLGFEYGNKLYGYITSFDPEYGRFGPGQLHIKFLIEYCIRNGLRELDLLRGREPYKTKWNPHVRKNVELRGFKRRFFHTVYEWISSARYARP
jgi:CelD/BcsL family acetyltransferase involved in cellulose biosynthesis